MEFSITKKFKEINVEKERKGILLKFITWQKFKDLPWKKWKRCTPLHIVLSFPNGNIKCACPHRAIFCIAPKRNVATVEGQKSKVERRRMVCSVSMSVLAPCMSPLCMCVCVSAWCTRPRLPLHTSVQTYCHPRCC